MSIQCCADGIILVSLPPGPWECGHGPQVREFADYWRDCHVVVDFSRVDVAGGAMLAQLLRLRQSLQDCGRRLVLCSVAPATHGVFTITRLDTLFDFVEDKGAAVRYLAVPGHGTPA
jgi:hypothetical protein